MINEFITHTKETITGERLKLALQKVGDDQRANAIAIRMEDPYASHITESQKNEFLTKSLESANRIMLGEESMTFWLWQRLNLELTGECIALLK